MKKEHFKNLKKYNLFKKDGEIKERFNFAVDLMKTGQKIFHLKYWKGPKRRKILYTTEYYNMIQLLDELHIDYELGNDAPRGGAVGDYIRIKADKRNKNYKIILESEK